MMTFCWLKDTKSKYEPIDTFHTSFTISLHQEKKIGSDTVVKMMVNQGNKIFDGANFGFSFQNSILTTLYFDTQINRLVRAANL